MASLTILPQQIVEMNIERKINKKHTAASYFRLSFFACYF